MKKIDYVYVYVNFINIYYPWVCDFKLYHAANMIVAHAEAPESSWAEAPQFSRKVQAQLEKDYKAEMQSFH